MELDPRQRKLANRGAVAVVVAVLVAIVAPAPAWVFALTALLVVPWLPVELGVALGASTFLAMMAPPLNLHWLHWVAYTPLMWALREDTPRRNRWIGYLYGLFGVFFIFSWISETIIVFSNVPAILAYLAVLLFSAAMALPYLLLWGSLHFIRRRAGDWWMLLLPALLAVIEWLSTYVVLFPYHQGVSQYRVPLIIQLVSVTGIVGVSWLLMFVNATLGEAIYRHREGRPLPLRWMSAAVILVAGVLVYGQVHYRQVESVLEEAPTLQLAQLQTHLTMKQVMAREHRDSLADWTRATARLPTHGVDLAVWAEGAGPHDPIEWDEWGPTIGRIAARGGYPIVMGGGWWKVEENAAGERYWVAFNSMFLIGSDGRMAGRYDKIKPLPFGEYIPFAQTFPWLKELIQGPGDFRAGTEYTLLEDGELRMATPVCYEAILPYLCRRFDHPNLLINVTNDAWFGDGPAPHQHAMLAAIRSTELGVGMVRGAYTGVSMVVEPHGRILYETKPYADVLRIVPVRLATAPTIYARFGDWFPILNLIGLLLAGVIVPWKRRRLHAPARRAPHVANGPHTGAGVET